MTTVLVIVFAVYCCVVNTVQRIISKFDEALYGFEDDEMDSSDPFVITDLGTPVDETDVVA